MRTINELYVVFHKHYPVSRFRVGLCINLIQFRLDKLITAEEYNLLDEHLQSQRPTLDINKQFYVDYDSGYWWPVASDCEIGKFQCTLTPLEVRKEFLKHLIEITK